MTMIIFVLIFSIYTIINMIAVYNNAIHLNKSHKIASRQLQIMELREHRDQFIYDIQKQDLFMALEKRHEREKKRVNKS